MDADTQRRAACCELVADVARSSGEVQLRLTGTSMLPAIWPGDVVTVRRCGVAELQPGQVVLHHGQGKLTAHRVVRIAGDHVVTRGDSVLRCDPPVEASEVVGQVVGLVRNGRRVRIARPFWHPFASLLLRRSDLCLRIALLLGSRPASPGELEEALAG